MTTLTSETLAQKYDRILSMLEVGTKSGIYTQIRCPVANNHKHEDKQKSASLGLHSNGISFKCFAGCQTDDFLKALGLTYQDLFPDSERIPTNIYTYHTAEGDYHHDKVKYRNSDGKKDFKQRTIDDKGQIKWVASTGIPFAYPQLIKAIKEDKPIIYTEGEKDALTAKLLGYEATTMGGASDWKDEFKQYFKASNLILIPDKDDPGLRLTSKMVDSLRPVVKSLKTLILPMGKDLTEWVEAGNHDLKPLIDSATTELITSNGIPEPIVKVIVGGFEFYWIGLNLKATIDHIVDDDSAEIAIYENNKPIYISGYKLLSISHKTSLAAALKKIHNEWHWDTIINQITVQSLSRLRAGEPVIWLDHTYGDKRPDYLIHPLFVQNNANIVYADRSSAKSLFMILMAILITLHDNSNNLGLHIPRPHRILFLDWENDKDTTGWVKQCLIRGMDMEWCEIPYLHCNVPLIKCLSHIEQKINEVQADTVIMDSLGVAVGGDLNASEPALAFYTALRQLPVTPLIIAHTAKDINNKRKTVYGNAFYENLARSIWELTKTQEPDSNEMKLSLFHRKAPPFSNYTKPLGFKFIFNGNKTTAESCEPVTDIRDTPSMQTDEDKVLAVYQFSGEAISSSDVKKSLQGVIDPEKVDTYINRLYLKLKIVKMDRGYYKINTT